MEPVRPLESPGQEQCEGPPVLRLEYAGPLQGRGRLSIRPCGGDLVVDFRPGLWAHVAGALLAVVFGVQSLLCLVVAFCSAIVLSKSSNEPEDNVIRCAVAVVFLYGLASGALSLLCNASTATRSFRLEQCGLLVSSKPRLTGTRRRAWMRERIDRVFVRKRQLRLRLHDGKEVALLPRCGPLEQETLDEVFSAFDSWLRDRAG